MQQVKQIAQHYNTVAGCIIIIQHTHNVNNNILLKHTLDMYNIVHNGAVDSTIFISTHSSTGKSSSLPLFIHAHMHSTRAIATPESYVCVCVVCSVCV